MRLNPDILMMPDAHEIADSTETSAQVFHEIEVLRHASPAVRKEAALALGRSGHVAAVPALIRALAEPNDYAREHIVRALVQIGIGGFPELIHALEDRNHHVREAAASVLQQLHDIGAIPALIRFLGDGASRVRFQAAKALGEIGDAAAVAALIHALDDSDYGVRSAAVRALGEIGDTGAIPMLLPVLADPNYFVRLAAVQALGRLGDCRVVSVVAVALRDGNFYVRRAAVQALGNIRDASVVPELFQALTDNASDVRRLAAEFLGDIGGNAVVRMLIYALADPNAELPLSGTTNRGEIPVGDLATFLRVLRNRKISVRRTAVEALGNIGNVAAVPVLINLIKDDDVQLAGVALEALKRIGDVEMLPRKVLAASHIAAVDRVAMLTALGHLRVKADPALRYRVLPISRYCRNLLKRDNLAAGVEIGAREVLAQQILLRPGMKKSGAEHSALLRAVAPAESAHMPAELVRSSDPPACTDLQPIPARRRFWALWSRFFT